MSDVFHGKKALGENSGQIRKNPYSRGIRQVSEGCSGQGEIK
jgi:hypothetical protein